MADVVTQSLFKPLHDLLFGIFKMMPNDGTHDQSAAFSRALKKSVEYGCSFGFDLSSATDRLPMVVQRSLLNYLFKCNLGDL